MTKSKEDNMVDSRESLYTCRWYANRIKQTTLDEKVKTLCDEQIEILSQLLGEPVPDDTPAPVVVTPPTTPPVISGIKFTTKKGEKRLWYPDAIQVPKMKAKGTFPNNYPVGCVVHFTAGNYLKGFENAKASCSYGATQGFNYMCMGTDGVIAQPNNLSEWGYHAGESKWDIIVNGKLKTVKSVSDHLIGMEMCNPGRLAPKNGKYYTYYDTSFKNPILEKDVRIAKSDDNIQAGVYLPYTKAQETALIKFLLWMKWNNPDVFMFENVVGHDECAGVKGIGYSRKNDPGGALSMTMTKFRELLKKEYAKL